MDHAPKVTELEAKGKTFALPNGALRKHHHRPPAPEAAAAAVEFLYRECLKNHAASLGGHALDGCGEFMLSPAADPADPTSFRCAACGCHRNFHRRLPDPFRHRDHGREGEDERDGGEDGEDEDEHGEEEVEEEEEGEAKIDGGGRDRTRPHRSSPPPFYSSAPHMLLALSAGLPGGPGPIPGRPVAAPTAAVAAAAAEAAQPRKRFRTKFSPEQKERMQGLSERLGWRMQKRDEGLVEECCREIGVDKGVFKVWMHNNKHTFFGLARRGEAGSRSSGSGGGVGGGDVGATEGRSQGTNGDGGGNGHAVNGSFSSSSVS